MKIDHATLPDSKDIAFLSKMISEEAIDKGASSQFAFFMRDEEQIIAGCSGCIMYGSIYTDLLLVHPDYRKKGLGRMLMEKVHIYGKEMHCTIATVATMSFQDAREFYENLGYECDFERHGYVDDATCVFLKKVL
ncbi:MAG: hypothetical protein PG981_000044 [Wolbachia endosymbiont of Ctenocephalides orientis wCori]|nr:MAG: hypothetical protein PG981_000044 [Wolbachia endosymbiont of Ctenocephalides orientis wCori]